MKETDPRFTAEALTALGVRVLSAMGCREEIAREVAGHLVNADLAGVYSHGIFRLTMYRDWAEKGYYNPDALPEITMTDGGGTVVDGREGFGILALRLAADEAVRQAQEKSVAAIGVVNVGHTGRIGEFTERAAEQGCLAILFGGGARAEWPQVAPYGGAKGMLPTNPYSFAAPGGENGPVMLDFATATGAGGKVYAAKAAGRSLQEGLIIDAKGNPSTNPDDYFNGGALLPMAGPKGYGMALMGELIGEAMLGSSRDGLNWIFICIDMQRFRGGEGYRSVAEKILAEIRDCPPAPGFERVEVPGERERRLRAERLEKGIPLPAETVAELNDTAAALGVAGLDRSAA